MGGDSIKSPEEIMTTYTTLQVLLNMVDTEIVDRTSELKRLESSIIDLAVKSNQIWHSVANMPLDCIYTNYYESVKYINRLAKKYFGLPLFKEDNESAVLEIFSQHGIDYKHEVIDVDHLIYRIKNA
jgi:hypothetical protein